MKRQSRGRRKPSREKGVSDLLGELRERISALKPGKPFDLDRIRRHLHTAERRSREGDLSRVANIAALLVRQLEQEVRKDEGIVPQVTPTLDVSAALLRYLARLREVTVLDWAFAVCPDHPPPPPDARSFRVDRHAPMGGDGSPRRPYSSINEALARADELDLPAVEVRVARDLYQESVEINRHTRVRGLAEGADGGRPVIVGTFTNEGPFALHLQDLEISPAGCKEPGAVRVRHRCAATYLEDVLIQGAQDFAVRQQGGKLVASGAGIRTTRPDGEMSMAAVVLEGGVDAALQRVELSENGGGALLVQGRGTRAYVAQTAIRDNRAHPSLREPVPDTAAGYVAVHVRDGAVFEADWIRLERNEVAGLYVSDGARSRLGQCLVSRTASVERLGGHGVVVSDGVLSMRTFSISDGDVAGVVITGESPSVDLMDGEVARNVIGMVVHSPDYDYEPLIRTVEFRDNDINVQSETLAIPEPLFPLEL